MAELTEFRRLLRQCLADSQFLEEVGLDFWALAPANVPFAWYGDVADIPDGWQVLEAADGRYITGSIDAAGTLGGNSADLTHSGAAVSDHSVGQPAAHGINTTQLGVQSGSGAIVLTSVALTNNHSGTTVSAHTVTQSDAHLRDDINPPSISFIWIMKAA